MRLPIAESMESRILTRTGANIIKCGGLAVSAYERERERERESSKIIGMAKGFGHYFALLNNIYVLSVGHICYSY